MRRYFSHAEISITCIANRTVPGALQEAKRVVEPVYLELLRRFDQEPDGRIILSIGWDDKKPGAN